MIQRPKIFYNKFQKNGQNLRGIYALFSKINILEKKKHELRTGKNCLSSCHWELALLFH